MIPLKLHLKNFLSYGPDVQTIDFSPYQLICLSGRNGHGKSALLDAITWALWGQARKTSGSIKADLGLLRLGQTQMMVSIDFECNGQAYRVRREFAKTYGKPLAALEFGLLNVDDDTVMPLTAKTIKETQVKIEQMLNLDFESFVNSAFLRQGQANEFSKKTPKDRKEVLATILGLNRYEVIRKLAMEKIRQATVQKNSVMALQASYEQELEKTATIVTAIKDLQEQLNALAKQEKDLNNKQTIIKNGQAALQEEQKRFQLLAYQLQHLEKQEHEQRQQLRNTVTQWRTIHKKLLNSLDHKKLEQERKKLFSEIGADQKKLQKHLELKESIVQKKEALQVLEKELHSHFTKQLQAKQLIVERLRLEKESAEKKLHDLEKQTVEHKKEKITLTNDVTQLRNALKPLEQLQKKIASEEKQFEKRKEHYQQLISQGNWTKKELDNLGQKKVLVQDTDNPSCPLCEQNLSLSRKRFLKSAFEKQEHFLQHRLARLSKVIKQLKTVLIEQHTQLSTLKNNLEQCSTITVKVDEVIKAVSKLDFAIASNTKESTAITQTLKTSGTALQKEQAALTDLQKRSESNITTDPAYKELYTNITELEKHLGQTSYDAPGHKKRQEKLQLLEDQLAELGTLVEQASRQDERKNTVNDLCKQIKQIKKDKNKLQETLKTLHTLVEKESTIKKEFEQIDTTVKDLQQQKEKLLQEKGSLENQKAKLTQIEQKYKEQQKAIATFDAAAEEYQAIATATGKDGIQALLIEDALPEIEEEANNLLAKLTNNQSHIIIESLRDLKSGGTKETLDIKISDAAGIRAYELFSGGEAFRIDFALRIAISKLLARRAGTALQTLIIDEGFGSQDEEGLSHIMDAIHKIQDDFCKVIIVSHLSVLKDQFPIHFVVEKGPGGSNVRVLEQD